MVHKQDRSASNAREVARSRATPKRYRKTQAAISGSRTVLLNLFGNATVYCNPFISLCYKGTDIYAAQPAFAVYTSYMRICTLKTVASIRTLGCPVDSLLLIGIPTMQDVLAKPLWNRYGQCQAVCDAVILCQLRFTRERLRPLTIRKGPLRSRRQQAVRSWHGSL